MFKKFHSFLDMLEYRRDLARSSILNNGWLPRGGSALLVGPSGCGKSKLKDWIICAIACGRPIFGIKPTRPFKVLSIQAEDTDEDVAESYQGYAQHELGGDAEAAALIDRNLVAITLIGIDGYELVAEIDRLCEEHKPDVVVIDPILSYIGCDVVDQKGVTTFLRKWLLPVMIKHACAVIAVHHSPKGAKNTALIDRALGSMEFGAFFRGILDISYVEGRPNELTLALAKRHREMGWKDEHGRPVNAKFLVKGIEGVEFGEVSGFEPGSKKIGGRPAKVDPAVVANLIKSAKVAGKPKEEVVEQVAKEFGYSKKQAQRHVAAAQIETEPTAVENQREMTIEQLEFDLGLRS